MAKLRVGVIGLGVGERHIAGYRAHPECSVVALADLDPAKRAAAAERYPGLTLHASAEALLDDPEIDVVSIASYDAAHFAQVRRALDAGKHVFAEKPLCQSSEELAALDAALARNPRCRLSSNLILRRAPRFRALKARIESGGFGRLFHLEADYNYGRIHKILDGWRGRQESYSVMLGGGVHVVDLLLWLAGERVVEVAAFGNRIATEGAGLRFDDMMVAILRFRSGATAKVAANFGCVFPHFHRLLVYGTTATFENGFAEASVWHSREPGAVPEPMREAYPGADKGDLIAPFIDAILGRAAPEIAERDVFATMSVCLAIDEAARRGAIVAPSYH
ncbi:MAG: Gfo/Idh/MocA family oxidoreductase [Alphaproteobacteria bacterium]|nr:Gfo/Idh/MocA family oxidoreductase [Alphaproteobacteria bacterium]